MSLAKLNGSVVTSCRVSIPAWGCWHADVEADTATVLTGAVVLELDDLTLRGTILTGGAYEARKRYRIVGGAGGWGRTIAAKSEANDLGVKLSTVLTSAAQACGETMGTIPAGTVGSAFVRAAGPAARVLDEVAPRGWYVDEAGVTQIGRRAAVTYAGGAPRTSTNVAQGCIELAPTGIATLLPGAIVDGIEAVDVEHVLDGKLRTTIWGRGISDTSRLPSAMQRMVEAFTAHHKFFAPWEYRVVQRNGERMHLQVVRVSSGLPDLLNVRVRPGVAGLRAHPKVGGSVLVSFINGDPARPVVTSFDDADSPGFVSDETAVAATLVLLGSESATDPVVRKSDLQSAVDSIRTWGNAHIHVETGGSTAVPTTPLVGPTATGSTVVKAV